MLDTVASHGNRRYEGRHRRMDSFNMGRVALLAKGGAGGKGHEEAKQTEDGKAWTTDDPESRENSMMTIQYAAASCRC